MSAFIFGSIWNPSRLNSYSFLIIFSFLAGCLPGSASPIPPPWEYADLRILAAPGSGAVTHQLVSLYTRGFRSDVQIRLDLLEYDTQSEFDLYLAIDTLPGGRATLPIDAQAGLDWDLMLAIPASGSLQAYKANGEALKDLKMRVARNPALDTLVISLDQSAVGNSFKIQAFLTSAGSSVPESTLGPVRSDAQFTSRLPVLLAFWNTFPAYTPSQAMRRFDGAHTGPSSDRHGLRGLLDALENAAFPAALLDLKTPAFLSALEYSGSMDRIRALVSRGLVILPDVIPLQLQQNTPYLPADWVFGRAAQDAAQVRENFDLPPSPFLYTPAFPHGLSGDIPQEIKQHRLIISKNASQVLPQDHDQEDLPDDNHAAGGQVYHLALSVTRWQSYTLVDLAALSKNLLASPQADYTGPSLEIRRALLVATAEPNGKTFAVLGGDLAQTSWGNPTAATQTLHYLKSRPWLQPMSGADLAAISSTHPYEDSSVLVTPETQVGAGSIIPSSPDNEAISSGLSLEQIHSLLLDDLQHSPENRASVLARQAYDALLAPPVLSTPTLGTLRAGYLNQIGHLLAASRWIESGPGAFCEPLQLHLTCIAALDLDWDGENEFIMASPDIFLVLHARGGYLPVAFARSSSGTHQIIAPSSQFMVGMGDPSSWEIGKGIAGDASQFRGAFSDVPVGFSFPSWEQYGVEIGTDSLTLISPDGSVRKTFSINGSGFIVDYTTRLPTTLQIPLVIDPDIRFSPGWGSRYISQPVAGGWQWGLKDGPQAQVLTTEKLVFTAFIDSREYMGEPEDPDFDFPRGHFLPFPMALVEISAQGSFSIDISIINKELP